MSVPPAAEPDPGPPPSSRTLAAGLLPLAAGTLVPGLFAAGAAHLLVYPWDWSPDEGLALDLSRRWLEHGLPALYGPGVVPFPDFYGPVLPLLLAPFAGRPVPLPLARAVPLLVLALALAAVARLVTGVGGRRAGWLAVALVLAPSHLSVWLLLVRADGPALALWLWAAVTLLPPHLARGAGRLGWRGAALGAGLLVAGVLTRPTTLLMGAPLALGWWLVDRASAARLAVALAACGATALALVQLGSDGGYLRTAALWRTHYVVPGQLTYLLRSELVDCWALWAAAALGFALAARAGLRPWRDPVLLLVAGGALMVPPLAKAGAAINYLLPLAVATAVLALRAWSGWAGAALPARRTWGLAVPALAALLLARQQTLYVPGPADAATAARFHGLLASARRATGAPLLALTPDYAYVLQGQPVEMHGSALPSLERAGAAGVEVLLGRLRAGRYGAVVIEPQYWPNRPEWHAALQAGYRLAGRCRLGYYYGNLVSYYVMVRGDTALALDGGGGARCDAPEAAAGR